MKKNELRKKLIDLGIYREAMAKAIVNRYKFPSYSKSIEIETELGLTPKGLDHLTKSFSYKYDTKSQVSKANTKQTILNGGKDER